MPSVKIHLSGGKYELTETVKLDTDKITASFYRLSIQKAESTKEAPIVTGTFDIPGSEFLLYD